MREGETLQIQHLQNSKLPLYLPKLLPAVAVQPTSMHTGAQTRSAGGGYLPPSLPHCPSNPVTHSISALAMKAPCTCLLPFSNPSELPILPFMSCFHYHITKQFKIFSCFPLLLVQNSNPGWHTRAFLCPPTSLLVSFLFTLHTVGFPNNACHFCNSQLHSPFCFLSFQSHLTFQGLFHKHQLPQKVFCTTQSRTKSLHTTIVGSVWVPCQMETFCIRFPLCHYEFLMCRD